jgi:hypothetical protein
MSMTREEARLKYGYHSPGDWHDGYVNCMRCPVVESQCLLIHGGIPGKHPTGYDDCWEYIAKVMTEQETESAKQETESAKQETTNAVDHPSHYAGEKYECIEVMREVFGDEATKNFCLLNAFKYLWRCGKKHQTPDEDIAKAVWYLEKYRSLEGGEKEDGRQDDTGTEGA